MTQFKEGDEVAWIVKYIKRDTTLAAIHDGVSISLETSPGNTVLVHNPQLYPAAALDVNKGLLAENERLRKVLRQITELSPFQSNTGNASLQYITQMLVKMTALAHEALKEKE